jgi:hypothetical protein
MTNLLSNQINTPKARDSAAPQFLLQLAPPDDVAFARSCEHPPNEAAIEIYLAAIEEEIAAFETLRVIERNGFSLTLTSSHDLDTQKLRQMLRPTLSRMWLKLRLVSLSQI